MSINVNEDVIGGGGIGGGWGGGVGSSGLFIFAILIIFVFAIFWGRGNRDGDGLGGHAALLPMMMNGHGGWGRGGDGCGCPPICKPVEDVAVAGIAKEVALIGGQIKTQAAIDTGAIIHTLDNQTCEIKMGEMAIIKNQTDLAYNAELRNMTNALNEKNMKIATLEADIRADRSDARNAMQFARIGSEIASIQCGMLKAPPFIPAGGNPYVNPFNFQHAPVPAVMFNNERDCRGCCA